MRVDDKPCSEMIQSQQSPPARPAMAAPSTARQVSPAGTRHQVAHYHSFLGLLPRRFVRLTIVTVCIFFAILSLLNNSHNGPSLGKKPGQDHLKYHETAIPNQDQDSNEPLKPFPESPMVSVANDRSSREGQRQVPWLAAVISPAQDIDRRMLIRSTWMRMYADVPFEPRFVVSNPGSKWTETVRFENRTYGDMIVLDHLPENSVTANTIKTLEFYKWLINNSRRYEFVSKIDTDLWFNARGFWDRYLKPRLTNSTATSLMASPPTSADSLVATVERTTIGQIYYNTRKRKAFPQGAMYTHTWDMVQLLVKLQEENPVLDAGEDRLVTILLQNAGEQCHLVNMNATEKFDFEEADARTASSPWARTATHPHAMMHGLYGSDMIAVHELKDRKLFMKIADCFDAQGVKPMPPLEGPEKTPPAYTRMHDFLHSFGISTRYETQLDRIPDSLYRKQGNDWILDGVWNMGSERTGFQDEL